MSVECHMIRLPDISREGLEFYPWTFFSFFVFLSVNRAQQPRSGWPLKVFRRFSRIWYRDLAHPDTNFHRGQIVRNLASFSTSLNFEPPAFENTARYPNSETNFLCRSDRPMFDEVGSTHPWEPLGKSATSPKCMAKRAKSSITRRWIIWFRSNSVQGV